ncbi:MAG: alpha-amylase family glycosyl hydrolase [Planctomycetota bacterium]
MEAVLSSSVVRDLRAPAVGLAIALLTSGAVAQSSNPGMGSIPYTGGVTFRVWAPNASAVAVAGDFNSWSSTADVLVAEGGGYWSLDVSGAAAGDEYRYVITNGSSTLWKNDPYAEEVTNSVGNSVVYDDNAFGWSGAFSAPAWNEMVIYEMHIGTFNDAPGGNPGDFDDAIARLGHLQDLGINAVKVMPINEFAGDFSWGYNPAHPFTIESAYGGPEKYKEFIQAAHNRGIAVIQDVVYNHLGPSDLDLWQFDGWNIGGMGGIYFFQDWRASTPWGDTRPDYGRGEVRQYLRDNALRWLNDFRVDGLRWDSTVNIRTQNNGGGGNIVEGWTLMQWINNEIDAAASWKIQIAEDLQNNEWITKTTGAGGAGFDAQWDANYVHPMRDAIITANDWDRDMFAVRDALYHRYNGDAFERVIYTESHDEVANGHARVPEEIFPGNAGSWWSQKRSTLGAAVTMTAPGIPMIFQGQEVLEDGYFQDTDPVDWSKETTYAGIESLYRDLIRLRRNWYNNTRGLRGQHINVHHVNNTNKVVAYHRWDSGGSGDDVIVIANFGSTAYSSYNIGMPSGGLWRVRFNSDWNGYSSSFGNHPAWDTWANWGAKDGMSHNANISVGPYTVVVLSKD